MGPHPAVAEVRRAVRLALAPQRGSPLGGQGGVLVACSGGADSLALAAAVAFEAPRAGLRCGLVTVDHGLQDGSDVQAARVAAIGYELGFDPVETIRVAVGADGGPEGAARAARYDALAAVADACDAPVLLGHTLDDQAETVLLGLGRGSGPRSIAGMRAVQDRWVRPLLGVRRATTEAACVALGLDAWQDPHNDDPAFRRVRLRREVLPLLEDVLGGGVAQALARTASLLQDDLDALEALARLDSTLLNSSRWSPGPPTTAVDHGGGLDVAALTELPRAIRTRLLRHWAADRGAGPLTSTQTDALDALITDWHGQGPVDLPGARRVMRASGKLNVIPIAPEPQE